MATLVERFLDATDLPGTSADDEDLERFGIRNLMLTAKTYNLLTDGATYARRRRLYRRRMAELLAEQEAPAREPVTMRDGWAIDDSLSNPDIAWVLSEAEAIIGERGMRGTPIRTERAFIRNLLRPDDLARFPSLLDFALSNEVLATVTEYMRQVPVLSNTIPPGIRLAESSIDGQIDDTYRTSQLYHLDRHDFRAVYAILLLRDSTPDSGPFTFLPASASARVVKALGYRRRKVPYRLTDEQVHSVVDPSEARPFVGPAGSILYIDSNRCMHYGSRDAHTPRYQLMCAYVSPCRTDYTEHRREPHAYPIRSGDTTLRRLLLDKAHRPG